MTIFGIGGFEVLLIGAIALFVLGPKRLLDGIRQGRRIYTDLKRQRAALQSPSTAAEAFNCQCSVHTPSGLLRSPRSRR